MLRSNQLLILMLVIFTLLSCTVEMEAKNAIPSEAVMSTGVKIIPNEVDKMKVLYIIAQEGFQDFEYKDSRDVLDQNGIKVVVSSITTKKAAGKYGMELYPEIAVKDVDLADFDMVVVIGGPGAVGLADEPAVTDILRKAKENDMLIGAICIAPAVLAKAGILEGKRATVWTSEENKEAIAVLEENGAIYVDEPVVVDGKLITGNGPEAAKDWGEGIVGLLEKI
ncbi:MAG: DJ-1/PfpI family protein [Nanoarchaeota archaeon]|nr:DJ-1/PfpI family protein [Nanoarchaeota archaeon]